MVLAVALFSVVFLATGSAQDELPPPATPQGAVELLHDGLVRMAAESGDAQLEQRYRQIEPVVAATHDLPYIAELTIRRGWDGLDPAQRQRFIEAFTRLSVATYAGRFRNLEPGMFTIEGAEPLGSGRSQVLATLSPPDGDAIPFEYVLHETDGDGWKIVNILADNVSDLALKRAEYRRVLQDGTVDDLILALEEQAANAAD
jgi:phospholipid transport system substrate-binding protein